MESLLHTRTQLSFSTSIHEERVLNDLELTEVVESAEGMLELDCKLSKYVVEENVAEELSGE